jgi:hypothetical protein
VAQRRARLGRVALLFFRTAFHSNDERFFLRDHKYWK